MTHPVRIRRRTASPLPGSVVRQLELDDRPRPVPTCRRGRPALRLALSGVTLRGPEKYRLLEHRRRQAQIKARRLLDLAGDSDSALAGAASPARSGEGHHER